MLERGRIVRANLAADAVLQRRDDLAARGVVFRVRGEHQQQVQRQPHRIALNLNVALLHDVEQADLDFAGQIGQFIDRENAAIGARQQSVVDRQLVRNILAGAGGFDRIDIADHVGDGDVGRRQFFDVSIFASKPGDAAFASPLISIRSRQARQIGANGLSRISQPAM